VNPPELQPFQRNLPQFLFELISMAKFPFIQSVLSEYVGVATNIARLTRSLAAMELGVLSHPVELFGGDWLKRAIDSPHSERRRTTKLIPSGLDTETDFALCGGNPKKMTNHEIFR
jgi:hypothetical protein